MPSIVLVRRDSDILLLVQVVKHRADLATTLVSCGAAGALVDQVPCLQSLPPVTLAASSLAQPTPQGLECLLTMCLACGPRPKTGLTAQHTSPSHPYKM